jgi:Cupin domain
VNQLMKTVLCATFLCGFYAGTQVIAAETETEPPTGEQTAIMVNYARLYTGADNETHFDDVDVTFVYRNYAEGVPPIWLPKESMIDVAGLQFVSMPAGWDGSEWHPAPRRQFIIPLSGKMEFRASDGETRVLGPGEVLLVEDTSGKGHGSRMVSSTPGVFAVMPLAKQGASAKEVKP